MNEQDGTSLDLGAQADEFMKSHFADTPDDDIEEVEDEEGDDDTEEGGDAEEEVEDEEGDDDTEEGGDAEEEDPEIAAAIKAMEEALEGEAKEADGTLPETAAQLEASFQENAELYNDLYGTEDPYEAGQKALNEIHSLYTNPQNLGTFIVEGLQELQKAGFDLSGLPELLGLGAAEEADDEGFDDPRIKQVMTRQQQLEAKLAQQEEASRAAQQKAQEDAAFKQFEAEFNRNMNAVKNHKEFSGFNDAAFEHIEKMALTPQYQGNPLAAARAFKAVLETSQKEYKNKKLKQADVVSGSDGGQVSEQKAVEQPKNLEDAIRIAHERLGF